MKCLQLKIISLTLLGTWARPDSKDIGRSFSLFSVVQFPNDECTTTSDDMKGICKSAEECGSTNGVSSGNCASGFGVCCYNRIEIAAGSTADIVYNGTYIQNPNFPTGSTVAGVYTYNVRPNNFAGICQLRIDLDTAVLANTDGNGLCATDISYVTSATFNNRRAAACGTLTGQHLYIETGKAATAGTITITTTGTATTRMWKYRVRFIECESSMLASPGCLQYFTGVGGDIVSLNGNHPTAPSMIQNLNYDICIRQEAGYCRMQLTETDPADATAPDSFHFDATATVDVNMCAMACLLINGNRYGGQLFGAVDNDVVAGPVIVSDTPFRIGVFTTGNQVAGSLFKLSYSQLPCGNQGTIP